MTTMFQTLRKSRYHVTYTQKNFDGNGHKLTTFWTHVPAVAARTDLVVICHVNVEHKLVVGTPLVAMLSCGFAE